MDNFEQIKILPDVPKHKECLLCGGLSEGTLTVGIPGPQSGEGVIRLCSDCHAQVIEADQHGKVSFSYYRCGRRLFIEAVEITN